MSSESVAPSKSPLVWLVAVGIFMETLDATILNTALPAMAKSMGESPIAMHSVIIAYSLTLAVFIPASGWIADRFGVRRIFFTAIALFTLGSLLCAVSQTLSQVVAARVLQGLGGSMLMPVGRLAILRTFPREQFLQAISFVAIPGLIGPLIGPTLGGIVVEAASWHWIFLINIPVGIAGAIATRKYMPDYRGASRTRFDFVGFLQLSLCMVTLSLALDGLADLGFSHATVLMLMLFSMACLVGYILHAGQAREPLFSLEMFKHRTFTVGLLGNLFARIGSTCMPFLLPLFLQVSLGYPPSQAGMIMIPVAIATILAKRLAMPLVQRFGYRKLLLINTMCVGFSVMTFGLISRETPTFLGLILLIVFGCAQSLHFTLMNSLTLKDLTASNASAGNTLFSMIQMLAMSLSVAAAGALLSTFSSVFGNEVAQDRQSLHAFHATFLCVGVITLISTWIFYQLPREMSTKHKNQVTLPTGD